MPSTPPNIMSPSPVPVVPIFSLTERNALSDFYDSSKGADWINRSLWLDESTSYCDWKGITCDEMNHVIKLQLSSNGLSGRLSESIGNLTFIEVLDLSDNYIKGPIPAEIGKLSNLIYLRLCYNAFTGVASESLEELTKLQLLHLQSNRITTMPTIPRLNDSIHGLSTFVTDCGEPSTFDKVLDCDNCTMCCNTNDECCPQVETPTVKWGLSYHAFNAFIFTFLVAWIFLMTILFYPLEKCTNYYFPLSPETKARLEEEEDNALSKICSDSVYSYFVTDDVFGWVVALITIGLQFGILAVFIKASEANFQDEIIDVKFTWKCPRDIDVCKDKADLPDAGWAVFTLLMMAFLGKDFIGGCKLLYHSTKIRHPLYSRIQYFVGGMCLILVTLTAVQASGMYNWVISTSITELIVNSVIILFVMALDEAVFLALKAYNQKWIAHADTEAIIRKTIDEMKEHIESQQREFRELRETVREITLRTSRNARVIVSWNRMRLAQMILESQVQRGQIRSTIDEMKNDFEVMGRKTDEMKNAFEVHKAVSFDFSLARYFTTLVVTSTSSSATKRAAKVFI